MAEGPGRRRGGGAGRHPGGWSDANLALCLPTSLLCPRLPLPFPTRSSPCLSGPPLCPSTCVLSFLVSSCVCVSLFFSVLVLLPMPVSLRVCFFPLQVGWRRKPTTDLNPTTSPISSLPPKPRRAPSSPPNFVFSGEGPSLPLAPTLAPPPQSISGPSLCPHPLLASLPPTPPLPPSPPLSSLFCVSVPLPLLPLLPSPLPGLFFTPPQRPPPWLMPSLVLDNYQIYQWGERNGVCCACFLDWKGGKVCPVLGDSHNARNMDWHQLGSHRISGFE